MNLQAKLWYPDTTRHLGHGMAPLGKVLDWLDLELFRITLAAHGTYLLLEV